MKSAQVEIKSLDLTEIFGAPYDGRYMNLDLTNLSEVPSNGFLFSPNGDVSMSYIAMGIKSIKNTNTIKHIGAGAFFMSGSYTLPHLLLQNFSFPNCEYIDGYELMLADSTTMLSLLDTLKGEDEFSTYSPYISISLPKCKFIGATTFVSMGISKLDLPNIEYLGDEAIYIDGAYFSSEEEFETAGFSNFSYNDFVSMPEITLGSKLYHCKTHFQSCKLTMPLISHLSDVIGHNANITFKGKDYYCANLVEDFDFKPYSGNDSYNYTFDCGIVNLSFGGGSWSKFFESDYSKIDTFLLPDNFEYTAESALAGLIVPVIMGSSDVPNAVIKGSNSTYYAGSPNNSHKALLFMNRIGGQSITVSANEFEQGTSYINAFAFYGGHFDNIEIPEGVVGINDYAFYGASVDRMRLPNSLKWFAMGTSWTGGINLETAFEISMYGEDAGVYFGGNETNPHLFAGIEGSLTTEIVEDMIKDAKIVGCAGSNTFMGSTLTIPSNVTTIGSAVFNACASLTSLTLNNGLEIIGDEAFNGCALLENLSIPSTVKYIGSYAFGSYGTLSLTIPDNVKYLGKHALGNLAPVTYLSCNIDHLSMLLKENAPDGLVELHLTQGNTTIYSGIPASDILGVTLPDNLRILSDYAFQDAQFTSITLPSALEIIGDECFGGCSLQNISLPSNLSYIGSGAFTRCSSLQSVVVPENVKTIEPLTFAGCEGLSKITLPSGLTSIGSSAIAGCGITELELPSTLQYIGYTGLGYNSYLSIISIPSMVHCDLSTVINDCPNLSTVVVDSPYAFGGGISHIDMPTSYVNTLYINATTFPITGLVPVESGVSKVETDMPGYNKYIRV